MMSLFIVLWLMGSSEKVKKAVAGYFNDPRGTANLLGTTMSGNGTAVTTSTNDNMQKLKEKLEQEIKARKELEKLSKQIEITVTPEGLRIELIEDKNGTFYQSGSARLSDNGQELLALLGGGVEDTAQQPADRGPHRCDAVFERCQLHQLGTLSRPGQLRAATAAAGRSSLRPGDAGARLCRPDFCG